MTGKGWRSWWLRLRVAMTVLAIQQGVTPDLNDIASPVLFRLIASATSCPNPALGGAKAVQTTQSHPESSLPGSGSNPLDEDDATGDESSNLTFSIRDTASRLKVKSSLLLQPAQGLISFHPESPFSFGSKTALVFFMRGGLVYILCRMTC